MLPRPPDWFWRVFDVPPWLWAAGVVLALYLIGIADPHCCITGGYDDVSDTGRW